MFSIFIGCVSPFFRLVCLLVEGGGVSEGESSEGGDVSVPCSRRRWGSEFFAPVRGSTSVSRLCDL